MKKFFPLFVLLVMLFTACAPQAEPTQQSILPVDDSMPAVKPTPTHVFTELTPAQSAAVSALSDNTGLSADKITLISTEAVTWSDGCLGVQRVDVMCTQALVDGFKIVLGVNGKEYEYHTNQDGSSIVLATGEQAASTVEDVVIAQLAQNLGLDKKDISVVSSADVEFPDACMGVAMQDVMCAQMLMPGKIIVLEANNIQYEYHTSLDGARVQPATLALTWKREGGIAGFCDSVTVFLSGEVYTNSCKTQPEGTMGSFATVLTTEEQDQFNTLIGKLGQAELDASDPKGVADRMMLTLTLYGNGAGKPTATDQQALFEWAQNLFQKLNS